MKESEGGRKKEVCRATRQGAKYLTYNYVELEIISPRVPNQRVLARFRGKLPRENLVWQSNLSRKERATRADRLISSVHGKSRLIE